MHNLLVGWRAAPTLLIVLTMSAASAQVPPAPAAGQPGLALPPKQPLTTVKPLAPIKPLPAPGLLQPVAPGTIQQRPPLTTLQPGKLEAWTRFAQLRGEARDPTSARLTWLPRQDATHYRVLRNGAALAELPAPAGAPIEFIDSALAPATTYTYQVEAIQQRAGSARRAPVARDQPFAPIALPQWTLLETSDRKGIVTPALEPPRDFSIALSDPTRRSVRVAWSLPKWATGVQVLRNGAPLTDVLDPRIASYDDTGLPPGTHRYALRTLYAAPGQSTFSSAPTRELDLRVGPFRILAFGDSIMWGQGLAESSKFTSLTRDALQRALNADVQLRSFAHSGAVLRNTAAPMPAIGQQEPTGFDQNRLVTPGEIPNGFPTVLHQINVQAPASGINPREVDLLLIDGCINDVGVMTILNPTKKPDEVGAVARTKCAAMAEVLRRAHEIFPNAAIVVTGYYPIVSPLTDLAALPIFVASAVGVAALAAPLAGLPPDPVLAVGAIAVALGSVPVLRDSLSANSLAFQRAADATLAHAAQTVSTQVQRPGLVSYVPAPFTDRNAYAAPDSGLWLVPTGLYPGDQDDVIAMRRAQCQTPGVLETSIGRPFWTPTAGEQAEAAAKCPVASMGHPNRRGAQAYADAIGSALQHHLPRWREQFAPVRRAP